VPDAPALLDLYGVCNYGPEAENALVKLTGLVEVKCGKADMGNPFMTHRYHSWRFGFYDDGRAAFSLVCILHLQLSA
jgi:hypothetical protein